MSRRRSAVSTRVFETFTLGVFNMTIRSTGSGFSPTRRRLLTVAAISALTVPAFSRTSQRAVKVSAAFNDIKAMTFDIQGTVVDYYTPFMRISSDISRRRGLSIDWHSFLLDWVAGASATIQSIVAGTQAWAPAGQIYRHALDTVLDQRKLTDAIAEIERTELMSVWGQMQPWHDCVEGIGRLKRKFTVSALSNAGMAPVISLSKRGGLLFDAVLTGELIHAYKPDPDVYKSACTYLGFKPEQIMMVAAHKWDLKAAREAGFKTAFVPRPLETGPGGKVDIALDPSIDIFATSLVELASLAGV